MPWILSAGGAMSLQTAAEIAAKMPGLGRVFKPGFLQAARSLAFRSARKRAAYDHPLSLKTTFENTPYHRGIAKEPRR
jgi:hypothetical protein